MANLRTTADIVQDAIFRSGENTDGSSDFAAQAVVYAQRAYQAIYSGGAEFDPTVNEPWWWLRAPAPGVLVLDPVRDATMLLTAGLTSFTLTSLAPAASLSGWWMAVSGWGEAFRIASHLGGASTGTLDAPWTGATGTQQVLLAHLDYDLAPDLLRVLAPMWARDRARVDLVDPGVASPRWPDWWGQIGTPDSFGHIGETRVRFNTVPDTAMRVEYDYLQRPPDLDPTGTQEPLLPREYRKMIADGALYFLFVDKSDQRADTAGLLVRGGLKAMQTEQRQRYGSQSFRFGQLLPRPTSPAMGRSAQLGWGW